MYLQNELLLYLVLQLQKKKFKCISNKTKARSKQKTHFFKNKIEILEVYLILLLIGLKSLNPRKNDKLKANLTLKTNLEYAESYDQIETIGRYHCTFVSNINNIFDIDRHD